MIDKSRCRAIAAEILNHQGMQYSHTYGTTVQTEVWLLCKELARSCLDDAEDKGDPAYAGATIVSFGDDGSVLVDMPGGSRRRIWPKPEKKED